MKSKQRIGFYGGTFDPIHFGHINLAVNMKEIHQLDEIWFCPAYMNPLKKDAALANPRHRMEMLALALADLPYARVIDVEAKKTQPSYTIDTLKSLVNLHPHKEFSLILGGDALAGFHLWHKPEEIVDLVQVFVGARTTPSPSLQGSPKIVDALKAGLTNQPILEISSTAIRERLTNHLYCEHLVSAKVLDYIYQNKLYSPPE